MNIKIGDFKSVINEPPEEDGVYLVVGFDSFGKFSYALQLEYTTNYGWNTTHTDHSHVIVYEETSKRKVYWTTVTLEDKE